jgi:type I restriction enzyme S subunit
MKKWDVKKLGEVCSFFNGQAHEKCIDENGKYKLINSKFVSSEGDNYKRTNNALSPLFVNDIVMVMSDVPNGKTLAKCFIVDEDDTYTLNQRICVIRSKSFNTRFLYYQLNRNKYLLSFDNGENQSNLRKDDILNCELLLPPLPEQQRIVAILDECFEAIAQAKSNAEQNLQNAKELFESYLQGVFDPSTRSGQEGEYWEERRFDEICVLQRGFDLPTHSRNNGRFPLVSSNGITDRIDLWKVKAPGVVTGRSGTIGNVHFIEEDFWPLNTALYIKNFHGNYERCIYYFLSQFDLGKYSSGAGVPTLNRNNVHGEKVWFPKSIETQQTIVQKLDALSAETKKLEAIYQQKINDLEELKKSVLEKAFSGQLTMSEL